MYGVIRLYIEHEHDQLQLKNIFQILCTYHAYCKHAYKSFECDTMFCISGRDFNNSDVTLGGDQKTRVFYDSAKNLRKGTHTRHERLDSLNPIVGEFFHLEQDLLEVSAFISGIVTKITTLADNLLIGVWFVSKVL